MTHDKSRCLKCRSAAFQAATVNNQDAWALRTPAFWCESVSPGLYKGTMKRSFEVEREF